jgi:ABC-2 type transport system permease protein
VKAFWATFTRELRAYFFSPLAYVVLFLLLTINGFLFAAILSYLNDPRAASGQPLAEFFSSSWLLLLMLGAILTMRLISDELKSGSVEVLMTAPVTEGQVVAGKYLAALAFFAFLYLPTVAYALILEYFDEVDWGPVAGGYLGLLLMGALFLAIGIFASSLTKSQLIAAVISVVLLFLLFLVPGILGNLVNGEKAKEVLGYLTIWDDVDEFARGIVDTRRLVFYLSTTVFFLFLTSRALADRKWR